MAPDIIGYLVAAMVSWAPPEIHRFSQKQNISVEEQDAFTIKRYENIANDLIEVVFDPNEEPIIKNANDTMARVNTAILVLTIASFEGQSFAISKDSIKRTGAIGERCLMQILLRPEEVMKDRKDCFRIGLFRIKESFHSCPNVRPNDRLAVYASGSCDKGREDSRMKMRRYNNWITNSPYLLPVSN